MFTYDNIIAVTNRHISKAPFLEQLRKIAAKNPYAIILREKDLTESEYFSLLLEAQKICNEYGVTLIAHTFIDAAKEAGTKAIHLPMPLLLTTDLSTFDLFGASVHSVAEAIKAEELGCSYVTAGHIFATDCKKGVPPRGLDFLSQICDSVNIKVFAIGGITTDNLPIVMKHGASGGCMMSGFMKM